MDKTEYIALKKTAIAEAGADDAESLKYYANRISSHARMFKWIAIFMGVLSIPLCLILIGFITLPIAIGIYFFLYRKPVKMSEEFIKHVERDPELVAQS